MSEDFDGDQIANGAEVALGLNPRVPAEQVLSFHIKGAICHKLRAKFVIGGCQVYDRDDYNLALGPWISCQTPRLMW